MSKPAEPERCAMCGHPPHDGDTCVVLMCYCTQAMRRPQPEAASEVPAFNKNADSTHVKGTEMHGVPDPVRDCKHGHLKRKCETCFDEAEIAALRAEVAEKTEELDVSRLNHIDANVRVVRVVEQRDATEARVRVLRKALEEIRAGLHATGDGLPMNAEEVDRIAAAALAEVKK